MHQIINMHQIAKLVYNLDMRTSITLDDDAYQLASLYARGRGITLSAAINEAVRKIGEAPRSASGSSRITIAPNGLPIFSSGDRAITPEIVKEALEDE
jgi:hypothetical protein